VILIIPPFTFIWTKIGTRFYPLNQLIFWLISRSWLILTWIGARPVEDPYVLIGQLATIIYFSYFIINPLTHKIWDDLIKPSI
jgi:ubiquinol-cytochrome c reductase cytochrome b subunit